MLVQLTIGVSYMFMDSFIKLYTGKVDLNKNLNPLLKGVAYGLLLQTLFWTLIVSIKVHNMYVVSILVSL